MIEILEALIRDPETNPTARCTAIRTLREIQAQEPQNDGFAGLDEFRPRRRRVKTEQRFVELTASQRDQLQAFIGEKDTSEERVNLRPAQTLPASYVEAVLLDADGEPTPKKRILFP